VKLTCSAAVKAKTLTCSSPAAAGGARAELLVGGQGTYVFLEGSNVQWLPGDDVWSAEVTVQNLIPQPLGTTDGATLDAKGVRVFFAEGPTVTDQDGGGPVTILNHDGEGTFTAAGQKYYQWDEVLETSETSGSRLWEFDVPADVDNFTFVVYVAAEVPFPDGWVDVTPEADSVLAGGTQGFTPTVRTVVGNPVVGASVTWGTSDAGVATVDASGTVTAVAPGTATITATSGARSGSATIAVCPSLAVGGVYVADMPAGASFCLGGGEYVVMPVNLSDAESFGLSVTGSGIVPVTGPPSPARLGGARFSASTRQPDVAFETRLREMSRRDLTPKMARARAALSRGRANGGARFAITPGVPAVGALMSLNVETANSCASSDIRTGRVMAVGTHVIVMADTMNPSGGFTAADYQAIADSFDTKIHPVVTANFDAPEDIDNNDRVIAFYTRAVNELTPPGSSSYVGGFVFARDLLPVSECPTSNVGELFYMLAPDPAGDVNGNVRVASFVMEKTLGTLAHEFQHLINASRRLYVNAASELEEVWMDEGLAHVAEELVFYQGSGLTPGSNLAVADIADGGQKQKAFFKYAESNFGRLRQWLLDPLGSGPFQTDDDLATRGAIWAFLRYAADRVGGTQSAFTKALVNGTTGGMDNLEAALGGDADPWFRDFAVAMYADDAGLSPAAVYTQPSWNFRSIYENLDYDPGAACSCAYELDVRDPANGVAEEFGLNTGGSAAYVRMGVSTGAFAGVTLLANGSTPPSTIRLAIIRRE
jgi:hypothetical protein